MEGRPCVALLDHSQDSASAQQEAVTTHPTLRTQCRPCAEQARSRTQPPAWLCIHPRPHSVYISVCVCACASFSALPTPNSKFLGQGLGLSRRSKTQRESRC